MSYAANNTDASAVAQRIIDRANATVPSQNAPTPVGDPAIPIGDALLDCLGYRGQSDAVALGAATLKSASFADVGNGSSTGFSTWTVSIPVAKTYLLHVDLSCFITTAQDTITFQVLVDGSTTGVSNSANMNVYWPALSQRGRITFRLPIAFSTTGNHTIKLQWKTTNVGTANVDVADFRTFTLTG